MVSPSYLRQARRLVLILPALAGMAATSRAGFTVQNLDVLASNGTSEGSAINASGYVAGSATNALSTTVAAVTSASGTFQPVVGFDGTSLATSINIHGNVAGSFTNDAGIRQGFYTTNGGLIAINPLSGGSMTQANGINDNGQVTGFGDVNGATRAFYLGSGASPTVIGPLGTGNYDVGNGINNSGEVVGSSQISAGGPIHAFISMQGGPAIDLSGGSFTGNSFGMAINNNGAIAGYGGIGLYSHAFFDPVGGSMMDLGVLPGATSSEALGLNDQGLVVGQSGLGTGALGSLAFLWGANNGMVNLNSLISAGDQANWVLLSASAINDSNQITGVGLLDGVATGFLLNPIAGESIFDPVSVPEPPAALLAMMGLALIAAWARFRRGRTSAPAVA